MLVQVQAYLGPDKPETLAEAVFEVSREPQYAVVTQLRETGHTQIWDVYRNEALATQWTERLTNAVQFGILCVARYTLLPGTPEDHPDLDSWGESEDPELALAVAE